MLKAIVADDHPCIRASVRMVLQQQQFNVVAEADNGADAVQLAREHRPDLMVLDITLARLDGLEVIARVRALGLSCKFLVLTSQSALFYSMRSMRAGAAGFISKADDLNYLVKAVRAAMDGYTFFPNLGMHSAARSEVQSQDLKLIHSLTDRELAILQQLAMGLSNPEIAASMLLSIKTVSNYKTRLIVKLKVKSVVCLAAFARRNELV
ncbi:response regulator transcription factor [Pseudomonas rhodesiae]|uniref:response regulator transcription factor n=1 Tax=Pseudomonas rhodesiae TaxID=76760 RepID=UPI0032B28AF6